MPAQSRLFGIGWDVVWLVMAGPAAYLIRGVQAPAGLVQAVSPAYLLASSLAGLLLWQLLGVKRRSYRLATQQDGYRLGAVAIAAPVIGLMAGFLFDLGESLPRSIPVLHVGLLLGALLGVRLAGRAAWHHRALGDNEARRQEGSGTTFLVGDSVGIFVFLKALQVVRMAVPAQLTIFATDRRLVGLTVRGVPVTHHVSELAAISKQLGPDGTAGIGLVVSMPPEAMDGSLRSVLAEWQGQVRTFRPVSDQPEGTGELIMPDAGLQHWRHGRARLYMPLKRLIDVLAALTLLALAALPFAIAVLAVRVVMGNPVFFWQWRPGRFGSAFKLVKLRSMRSPIDAKGNLLTDEQRLGWTGRFLRRTRLDEVPQLWSILVGEMSLIGPRPLIFQQQSPDSRRLWLRPGLSGWAQVNGGQLLSAEDKESLDCYYVDNVSLWLDLKIILLTAGAVLLGDRLPEGMKGKSDPLAGADLARHDQALHDPALQDPPASRPTLAVRDL